MALILNKHSNPYYRHDAAQPAIAPH